MKKFLLLVLIFTSKICFAQNVGIGTLTPTNKLQVVGDVLADSLILGNGINLPLLQFKSDAAGRKIALWPQTTNDNHIYDGLGLELGFMRYQVYSTAVDHAFFAGTSPTSSNELMRIKGNGNVGIGASLPTARLHVADSSVLFSGPATLPASTTFDPPASGAGVRMFWYPEKAAFRAGVVGGAEWNKSNIGNYSFATGSSNQANGKGSFSTGLSNISSGENSFTGGYINSSSGYSSLAFGQNNVASNNYSIAMGFINNATASNSVAIGTQNNATALYSTALGYLNTASGYASTVMGQGNSAAGSYSLSAGRGTIAKAIGSTSLGYYNENTDAPNANVEAPTDRILQVGNGDFSTRTNALTILRNGNTGIGNTDPAFLLDMSKRIRLRSENTSLGAGIWFNNNNNSALNTFVGNDLNNNLQIYSAAGNRTIATFNPTTGGIRVEGPVDANSGNTIASFGGNGDFVVDKPGVIGGRFLITENGNIGIGNNNPNTALTFAPSLGKKITLYPGATGDVGFGVAGNRLQIYADNPNADVAIGYDAAGTFNEKFAVKPTGALALSGNTGAAGQVLVSNGSAAPAQWQNPAASTATVINTAQTPYGVNTYFLSGTTALELPNLQLTVTIPTGVTARLMLSATVWMQTFGCFGPSTCIPSVGLFYMIDGSPIINAAVYHSAQANNVASIVMANSPYNIGAGTHTIKWFLFNNGDNLSITAKPTFSSLMAFLL